MSGSPRILRTTVAGFEAFALENARIRVVVIPALGGRIWRLTDRRRRRQWLWHRHDVALRPHRSGASYDDVWAGGWEELFPNDAPCIFEGRDLPDHGEWWTRSWMASALTDGGVATLRMETELTVVRTSCVKEIRVADDEPTIRVHYTMRNREPKAFHFLFKQHLPVRLSRDCQLLVPGGHVEAVDPSFGTILPGTGRVFDWPCTAIGDGAGDLSRTRPKTSGAREFVYVSELPGPWCAVVDRRRSASLRLDWSLRELPYLWLFMSYGGWRETHTVVLEPCSNKPKDLREAVRRGQAAVLGKGGVFRTEVAVTLGGPLTTDRCHGS